MQNLEISVFRVVLSCQIFFYDIVVCMMNVIKNVCSSLNLLKIGCRVRKGGGV